MQGFHFGRIRILIAPNSLTSPVSFYGVDTKRKLTESIYDADGPIQV